jgi:hypothetical protein
MTARATAWMAVRFGRGTVDGVDNYLKERYRKMRGPFSAGMSSEQLLPDGSSSSDNNSEHSAHQPSEMAEHMFAVFDGFDGLSSSQEEDLVIHHPANVHILPPGLTNNVNQSKESNLTDTRKTNRRRKKLTARFREDQQQHEMHLPGPSDLATAAMTEQRRRQQRLSGQCEI